MLFHAGISMIVMNWGNLQRLMDLKLGLNIYDDVNSISQNVIMTII